MSVNPSKPALFSKARLVQVSTVTLLVVIVLWILSPPEANNGAADGNAPVLKVTTLSATPGLYTVRERIVGKAQPRWPVTVVSAVEGRVESLSEDTEVGDRVAAGTQLVAIDDVTYRAQLSAAVAQVKQAEMELARYRHEQTVVEQVSTGKTLSAFGRFEPHIDAAEANLNAARDAHKQAQRKLSETRIAPSFDTVILGRHVVPGQWINAGDTLFTLIAADSIDVYSELSVQQLQRLGTLDASTTVKVIDAFGVTWPATLRNRIPSQSSQTRQSQVVFFVEDPYRQEPTLLPDSMVTVLIEGREINNVVSVPSSVLTPDGNVWVVENQRLNKAQILIHEEFNDVVWFEFAEQPDRQRTLVRFPLSSMLVGQEVETLESNDSTLFTHHQARQAQ